MMVFPIVNLWEKRLFTPRAAYEQHVFVKACPDAVLSCTYEIWNNADVQKGPTSMLSSRYCPSLFGVDDV